MRKRFVLDPSFAPGDIVPLIDHTTRVIEPRGQAVVPGFIDCHTYMGLGSFPAHRIIEVGLPKGALLAKLACEAQTEPELPIIFTGWFPVLYGGNPDEINAISPGRGCPENDVDSIMPPKIDHNVIAVPAVPIRPQKSMRGKVP